MLTAIEEARAALERLAADTTSDRTAADVRSGAAALEQKLVAVEERLQDLRITGRGQDAVRWPTRIGGQLSYLASEIASSDFAPTSQQRAVQSLLTQELRATRTALEELLRTDVARFNAVLSGRGLKQIEVRLPGVAF
jgi:hypothetical protein